jgi:hypothetical protein
MGLSATARRRWFGALVLVAAVAMLIAGETVLDGRLDSFGFLIYWLACLGLTGATIFIAFFDARAVARRICQEERELLNTTFRQIKTDAQTRPRHPANGAKR